MRPRTGSAIVVAASSVAQKILLNFAHILRLIEMLCGEAHRKKSKAPTHPHTHTHSHTALKPSNCCGAHSQCAYKTFIVSNVFSALTRAPKIGNGFRFGDCPAV